MVPKPFGAVGVRGPAEGRIEEGTNHAIFGRGAGVDVEIFTRTPGHAVGEAIPRAASAKRVAGVVGVGVGQHVDAQIAAQLDAGVGAGDVVEARPIEGADPHIFYRFRLQRKIGCLCPTHRDETRR